MNEYRTDPSALYTCTSGGLPTSGPDGVRNLG